ncbi:MAG: S4 domain-containing protein [Hyphomicrobiaceae bacterium]|nr:S4 domain-containing protein [Hyphomicrobiaceae bacterium]
MHEEEDEAPGVPGGGQRLDKWLWYARLLKSRTLAAAAVSDGRVRVNRVRVRKPAHPVGAGDVITLAWRGKVRVLKVLEAGSRRGPPAEARALYQDLSAPDRPGDEAK